MFVLFLSSHFVILFCLQIKITIFIHDFSFSIQFFVLFAFQVFSGVLVSSDLVHITTEIVVKCQRVCIWCNCVLHLREHLLVLCAWVWYTQWPIGICSIKIKQRHWTNINCITNEVNSHKVWDHQEIHSFSQSTFQ